MAAFTSPACADFSPTAHAAAHLFAGTALRDRRFAYSPARLRAAEKAHLQVSRDRENQLPGKALPDVRADRAYAPRSLAARDDVCPQVRLPHWRARNRDSRDRRALHTDAPTTTPPDRADRRGGRSLPLPRMRPLRLPISEDIPRSTDPSTQSAGTASSCLCPPPRRCHRH